MITATTRQQLNASQGDQEMNKILTIVIAAAVMMMVAVSMMFMFSDSGESAGDLKESAASAECRIQVQQYCGSSTQLSDISQQCIDQADQQCGVDESQLDEEVADRSGLPVIE